MTTPTTALESALKYRAAGFSVVPIVPDGSKAPALASWEPYQKAIASEETVRRWYAGDENSRRGVGIVCGEVSGNLAVFDVEYFDYYLAFRLAVEAAMPGLIDRLPRVITPGKDEDGGRHLYARCETSVAGCVVAKLAPEDAVGRNARSSKKKSSTAIEIIGSEKQVLAPGTPAACHESGRLYRLEEGSPDIIDAPVLTVEEFKILKGAARKLDAITANKWRLAEPPREAEAGKPGAVFNREADWASILQPHGWTLAGARGDSQYWTRPGKEKGISATTGFCKGHKSGDLLYVFSSNAAPLEPDRSYSKFGAFTALECGGDFGLATREIHQRFGYGEPPNSGATVSIYVDECDEPPPDDAPPEWPAFVLPPRIEKYAHAVAKSTSCPVDFPAMSILAVAASAIGASRDFAVTRSWRESPRMYVALVAEPGGGKSPAVEFIVKPLAHQQSAAHNQWLEDIKEYAKQKEEYDYARSVYIKKPEDSRGEEPECPERPIYPHLFTTNITTEALMPMLAENPRGFLMLTDELAAWVTSMNQYKGGKGADRQFWLSAWSGSMGKVDRKADRDKGPLIVPKPFINVLGGIQPDMLSSLKDEKGREEGFLHRIIFSFPRETPWPEKIGEAPPEALEKLWFDCLLKLWAMEMEEGEDGMLHPVAVGMTADASAMADEWYAAHARERREPGFLSCLVGPWSKLRAYFFRFALTLHYLRLAEEVCDDEAVAIADRPIDADSMERAAALMAYVKGHLKRTYVRIADTADDVKAGKIVEWIRDRGGRATARDVMRGHFASKGSEAQAILKELVDRGFGVLEEQPKPKRGPQPMSVFVLHGDAAVQIHEPTDDGPKPVADCRNLSQPS